MRRLGVVLLLFVIAVPAVAGNRDFKNVVKGVEKHYGLRRSHPYLLGFAMFVGKPAMWGSGASGLKLAVFEDEKRDFTAQAADLDRIVAEAVGPKWQRFVRVNSRKSGESTVIYVSFAGKQMRMMIATVERGEIAVVHVQVSEKEIGKWMDDPGGEAKGHHTQDR